MAEISRADLMDLSDRLSDKMDSLAVAVAQLQVRSATEADRCPFREDVAQVSRNTDGLEKLTGIVAGNTDEIHALRRANARLAGLAAGVGAVIGSLGGELAKAFAGLLQ